MDRLIAKPSGPLRGVARVPSDKSMSHRALMLGSVAHGVTRISGLLEAGDVMSTAAALRAFGADVERSRDGLWTVRGTPWRTPARALDLGNAGTGVRLLMGLAAGQRVGVTFVGDPSLMRRPMGRVLNPLRSMGLAADDHDGRLPVTLHASSLGAFRYVLPMPSAQVKSAILLAGLGADGPVEVVEDTPTRDHTETMLAAFGADVDVSDGVVTLRPGPRLIAPSHIHIPADPSSAAFPMVAALISPSSEVTLEQVMLNPRRTGLIRTLERMGAQIQVENRGADQVGGEPAAHLTVRTSALRAATISPSDVPDMIDEIPILAVAAALAEGTTRIDGLAELRVKESDRLEATAALLRAAGVICRSGEDWLEIDGGQPIAGGCEVDTDHDHRIGMAAAILGLVSQQPITITGADAIATSFPEFRALMNRLGGTIESA